MLTDGSGCLSRSATVSLLVDTHTNVIPRCTHHARNVSLLQVTHQREKSTSPRSYLRQDRDAEGSAGVLGSQVDGDFRKVRPRCVGTHPACQLGSGPETVRKFWNLDKT